MKKTNFILAILLILAITAVVITALITTNRINNQDRLSVTGSGTVYAKADIANLIVGFTTGTKVTAVEATQENTKKMNEVIGAVKDLGVEEKDIKTTDYRLNPVYDWTDKSGRTLKGYEVSQNITIKIRELEKIGDIIAKTTEKGANQIGNINFTIDDEYELRNQARELAIEKAKEKAEQMADEAGIKLGRVKNVYENVNYVTSMMDYSNAKMESSIAYGMGGAAVSAPSIETGQNEIKVEVTLLYAVK